MTATQVFLRFIKDEYTNSDGTIDMKKYNLWRKELRSNYISCEYEYVCGKLIAKPRPKNFIDKYISANGFTLAGFGGHFFNNSPSSLFHMYGRRYSISRSKFIRKWRDFISNHVDGKINSAYRRKNSYTFSWKE
jgi:hypothetical protein